MDILNLLPTIYEKFILFMLIFTRISAMFSTFVLFKREMVNPRVILILTSIISFYVLSIYPIQQQYYDMYSIQMLIQVSIQFLIGFVAGLILNIILEIFIGMGQIISGQIGLSLASMIDPKFGHITSLTQFYSLLAMLIFLLINGHLFIIHTIVDSFVTFPIYENFFPNNLLKSVLNYSGIIFVGGIMLSISIVVTILLANIALAVMTKFAPQINVFSIGINMTLILGLLCVYLTFNVIVDSGDAYIVNGLNYLHQFFTGKIN